MKSRGEIQFLRFPRFAAGLYSKLTQTRPLQQQYQEIAAYLTGQVQSGRLLDIGTGPGRLLVEVHKRNPRLQLYGLDISQAMIGLARHNLAGVTTELKMANVCATGYEDDFFEAVVCTGSFYLWDRPEQGLEEIHRILKPGCSAHLFETNRDHDRAAYRAALKANLKREGLAMRLFGPLLLAKALPMAYRSDEVETIVRRTSFAGRGRIQNTTLAGLPIWLHIQLTKGGILEPSSHGDAAQGAQCG
jgi:ubiquinone/menaquinone biosynthesis C-methylase UbiE